jgi:hypothetical protein
MVTALVILSLAAIAISLMGDAVANQVRRTQMTTDDAQLRELLIAGAAYACAHPDSTARSSVSLPDALQQSGATLTVSIRDASDQIKSADIEASIGHRRLSQHLNLARTGSTWSVTQATLEP